MADANRSTRSTEDSLDAIDTLTASIAQAQSILTAVRIDETASNGGALTLGSVTHDGGNAGR